MLPRRRARHRGARIACGYVSVEHAWCVECVCVSGCVRRSLCGAFRCRWPICVCAECRGSRPRPREVRAHVVWRARAAASRRDGPRRARPAPPGVCVRWSGRPLAGLGSPLCAPTREGPSGRPPARREAWSRARLRYFFRKDSKMLSRVLRNESRRERGARENRSPLAVLFFYSLLFTPGGPAARPVHMARAYGARPTTPTRPLPGISAVQ